MSDKKEVSEEVKDGPEDKTGIQQESREEFYRLFEDFPAICNVKKLIFDENGKVADAIFISVNKAFENAAKIKASEVIGRSFMSLYNYSERPPLFALYDDLIATSKPVKIEYYSKNGKAFYRLTAFLVDHDKAATISEDIANFKLAGEQFLEHKEEARLRGEELLLQNEELRQATESLNAANMELAAAHARLSYLYEYASVGYLTIDDSGTILEINQTGLELLRRPKDDVMGRRLKNLLADGYGAPYDEFIDKVKENHARVMAELKFAIPNGEIDVQLTGVSAVYEKENPSDIQISITDITERKKDEESLRQSEERYCSLFENTLTANILMDVIADAQGEPVDGRFVDVNPAFEKMVGMQEKQVINQTLSDIYPETWSYWFKLYRDVVKTGRPHGTEDYIEIKNRYYLVYVYRPAPGQIAASFADITNLKKAEADLRRNEEWFRGIYEESPIGIEIYDSQGLLIDSNQACLDMFGVTDISEVSGFKLFDDPNLPDDIRQKIKSGENIKYDMFFDFGKVRDLELYKTGRSGFANLSVIIKPMYHGERESLSGYLVLVQDTTERKKAEQALRESEGRLRESVRDLEAKNIAMREVLSVIESEKLEAKQKILKSIDSSIIPIVSRLVQRNGKVRPAYYEALKRSLQELVSEWEDPLLRFSRLTPREYEICNLIRNGATSKEIAGALGIETITVSKHREQIRRKLGLVNKNINLTSFLKSIAESSGFPFPKDRNR
jgi:PAS domain S-box-containing protein